MFTVILASSALNQIFQYCLILLVFSLSLGLGAVVTKKDIIAIKQRPQAFAVGLLCQVILMPFFAFLLCLIFDLNPLVSLSVIILSAAPGGSTSNLCTLWSRGNVTLSISLTAVSTFVVIGTMPMNLAIYSGAFVQMANYSLPYDTIILTLLLVLIPVSIGIYIRSKSEMWAKRLEKSATIAGIIFLVGALIFGLISEARIFQASILIWIAAFFLQLLGSSFGYGISRNLTFLTRGKLTSLDHKDSRTIALETGLQNSTLAMTIITFAYSDKGDAVVNEMLVYPLIYSLFLVIHSGWISAFFRFYLSDKDPKEEKGVLDGSEAEEGNSADSETPLDVMGSSEKIVIE